MFFKYCISNSYSHRKRKRFFCSALLYLFLQQQVSLIFLTSEASHYRSQPLFLVSHNIICPRIWICSSYETLSIILRNNKTAHPVYSYTFFKCDIRPIPIIEVGSSICSSHTFNRAHIHVNFRFKCTKKALVTRHLFFPVRRMLLCSSVAHFYIHIYKVNDRGLG